MFAVVPSEWYENLPYSVMEPMSQAKPVIGARIGGIPELIEHGVNGLLFESGNATDLKEKLICLMENDHLRKTMGQAARKKVEERFCAKVHYQQLMSHYERLLSQKC
jgi:glycosyltransferase involved in cell wall biosynthesis